MAFQNLYTHRRVADTAAKSCEICHKPSSSVLVTPDSKDFFYVCPSHLQDRGFCSPVVDKAAVEAKKRKEMEEEIERVKKEYEEKQQKKKKLDEEKEKAKEKGKEKEKDKGEKSGDEKKDDPTETDKNKTGEGDSPKEAEPRVFALHRNFFLQRIEKKRQAEIAKRNRERMANPSFFPSVPKGSP